MKKIYILLLIIFSLGITFGSIFIGADYSDLTDTALPDELYRQIILNVRLPRVIVGILVGAILSVGGYVFQSLFRNSLATPYTLGVASGASFGASIYFFLGFNIVLPFVYGASIFAFLGSVLTMVLISGISRFAKDNNIILLLGVALSFLFSSLIMFVQYISDLTSSYRIVRFMIGGLEGSNYQMIILLLPVALIGIFAVVVYRRELDMIAMSDDFALSRGVNIFRVRLILNAVVSVMVGVVVSLVGPIGFIGMMIPHISRLILKGHNRYVLALTVILGGLFLILCDLIARLIISPAQMPVGIITSMLGCPFFIYLLIRGRKKGV